MKYQEKYRILPRAFFTIVLFLTSIVSVMAMDINLGEDRYECPGVEITLGETPLVGPDPVSSYKISWYTSTGGLFSNEANPKITVPEVETVYKVVVEDQHGFVCEETITITPIKIESVSFDPENLPADGQSTSQGSAQISVSNRSLVWKIDDSDGSDASINQSSGLLTAGTQPGTVTVKVQEKEAAESNKEGCSATETVCVGDPENCCPDVVGEITFGSITANISAPLSPSGSADEDGYCAYNAEGASINLGMEGFFAQSKSFPKIDGVKITWKQKGSGANISFKEVKIDWDGNGETRKFGVLQANLTHIDISVNSSGQISGAVTFSVNQVEPVKMGGIAILQKGTTGSFTFKYTSSSAGFQGDYDFSGVKNIRLVLKKQSKVIAKATGSLSAEGVLNAKFQTTQEETFSTNKFTATLNSLNWDVSWNIKEETLTFHEGNAKMTISEIENTKGNIVVAINMNETQASGTATFDNLIAFGCTIEGKLDIEVNNELEILGIQGTGITAKHNEFTQSFEISSFVIQEGKLISFSFNGELKYKNGITFNVLKADYSEAESALSLTTKVVIGNSVKLDVTKFTISGGGAVSIGGVAFRIDQFPFEPLKGSLAFEESGFAGSFTGKVKGGVGISGEVVVGAIDDYNYAFFALAAKSQMGIKIGPVIKMEKIGGLAGYNYDYLSKSPAKNTYVFGFSLGISDVANMVDLYNEELVLTIGESSSLKLSGLIAVPGKGKNKYLEGTLDAIYYFGTNAVSGETEAAVKVPAKTGTAVSLNAMAAFNRDETGWRLATSGDGQLFKAINFTGEININAPASSVESITGNAWGDIGFQKQFRFIYPDGFDGTSCETADASDNFVGFGADGYLNVELGGAFKVALDQEGFTGEVSANASGESSLKVKWPCTVICKPECVNESSVNISGEIKLSYDNKTVLSGDLNFQGQDGEAENKYVELEF